MNSSSPLVIAIDGPAGSGKSTTARAVARRLGLPYLDTGAMYRSVALAAVRAGADLADAEALGALARGLDLEMVMDPEAPRVRLRGEDVTDRVRAPDVTGAVSAVAAVPEVRRELVRRQRAAAGPGRPGLVADGRDLGTVVYPDATVRIFLTASPQERARRRAAQPEAAPTEVNSVRPGGDSSDVATIAAELARRDAADSGRAVDPLRPADGALVIDNTDLGLDDVVARILSAAGRLDDLSQIGNSSTGSLDFSVEDVQAVEPVVEAGPPPYPSRWLFLLLRRPLTLLLRLLFRLRVEGVERIPSQGPVLVIGNHSGFLDGPLVVIFGAARRRVQVLAKVELFSGVLGTFLRAAGQIPVRRGQPDRAALRACTRVLLDGGALAVFPEGTRGEGMLDQVRHGSAYVLVRSGLESVPVVPVVCLGTAEALPRGARLPRLRSRVRVVFGEPFTVRLPEDRHSRRAVGEVAEDLRGHLLAHLDAVTTTARAASAGTARA